MVRRSRGGEPRDARRRARGAGVASSGGMAKQLAVVLVLAACGGDDPPADPDAAPPGGDAVDPPGIDGAGPGPGSATITGTIAEQTIEPTTAFYGLHPIGGYDVLVLSEGGTVCRFDVAATGQAVIAGFPCGPAAPGSYPIRSTADACEPGTPHVWMIAEGFDGKVPEHDATGGTLEVTGVTPFVIGTLTADFGPGDAITGTFSAVPCQ
jgi:hypothetical protein